MKITRVSPVVPIPPHHLRWCGVAPPEKKVPEKKHELSSGELILYNKFGKLEKFYLPPETEK